MITEENFEEIIKEFKEDMKELKFLNKISQDLYAFREMIEHRRWD